MKKILLVVPVFVGLMALSFINKPKAEENGEIKWMTWKEAQEAQKKEPRKIVVDVYTDWCGWCKRMDATTFKHAEIVKYVGAKYYAVKFDAETPETIHFNGKDYKYVSQGNRGYNELAAEILSGQLSYPTTVFFDEQLNEIFPVPGYLAPQDFETVLNYVGTDSYQKMKYEEFQPTFKGKVNSN
jgi:thioredoxin-related protein